MQKKEIINIVNLKKLFSSCLLLVATAFCYGQHALLNGLVINEKQEVIANVTILAKQGVIIKAFTNANSKGEFKLKLTTNQTYDIELSSMGYEKLSTAFTATITSENKTFTLKQKTRAEDTVRVVAQRGVYEKGDTIFYNTDVFKRNNETNLKDLLRNMPGIIVSESGKIIADGQMVTKLLIDGKDLTGENYEKIVNNLSPHGLDQIQVLKKYKDPFELSNSATGNTEVAINLTFKNKKIIPNAKVGLSIGYPIKYYEEKADFLVLTKPITSINFININSIGNTSQLITSPNSLFGNVNTDLFKKLGKGLPYQNNVNELFLKITKNYYSFNNTQFYDNSSQFNIGKKITDKFTINYTPEKIEQTENGFSKTFVDNQLFAETNSLNKPLITRKTFSIKNELIWMLQKNEQIKINSSFQTEKENSINNSILNSTSVNFLTQNKKSFGNSLINYTKFLKNGTMINVAGFYEVQQNRELLDTDGLEYNNTIISSVLGKTKALQQNLSIKETNVGSYFKLIKRKNDCSFTFQPTYRTVFGQLTSKLSAIASNNLVYPSIDSFNNNYNYRQNSFSFPIRYNLDKDKYKININIEPIFFYSHVHRIKNIIFNYNASLNFYYEFKSKRRISFFVNRNTDFSYLTRLFAANTIVGNRNKMASTNFLLKDQSYFISINTYKSGSYYNKSNFSYSSSFSINSPNHLLNNLSNNFYTIQNYFLYDFNNKSITGTIRNSFTPDQLSIRIENDFSASSRSSISSQNNNIIASTNNNFQLSTRLISRFKNSFNFQFNNTVSYATNKRENSNFINKGLTNVTGLDVNFNYMKKKHLDIEAKNYYFNTYTTPVQNILLFNVSYKQLLYKNKIRLSLELRNLTNKKAFVSQNISITQFSENQVLLLPFLALLKLEFLL